MFYDIYEELCRLKGEAPSRAAEHMGLNRATVTFWKKESFCPRQATLSTVADYFGVPAAYLLGEPVCPCPLCGGDAVEETCHAKMRAAADKYGFCWPEGLCQKQLAEAKTALLTGDGHRDGRIKAVKAALSAWFSRSLRLLEYPPDHPAPAAYFGRVLWEQPPTEWLPAEELCYLRECYPPPATAAPCHIPRDLFEQPPPPAANVLPVPASRGRIPVLGRIAAGDPVIAEQTVEEWLETERAHTDDLFALRVKGDSMVGAGIPDGAVVIVRRQNTAEDGQIAACMVSGEDATLKRIRRDGDHLILCPENPAYPPRVVPLSAFENGDARILGVAVEVRSYFSF